MSSGQPVEKFPVNWVLTGVECLVFYSGSVLSGLEW